jgi:uncharacterized protein YndB with AHSA1/START domain
MIDLVSQLTAVHRDVVERETGGEKGIGVVLRREYDAPIEDVWDAVTDPDRLRRWFLPVSGDLRVGGTFQLEGNAGGEVLRCEPPRLLRVSWGGPTSLVDLRLSAGAAGGTSVELEHTVPLDIAGSGAGGLYVGPGWDLTLLGLGGYLRGEVVEDPVAWDGSPEVRDYSARTIDAWAAAVEASGTASAEEIAAGVAAARSQFTPEPTA